MLDPLVPDEETEGTLDAGEQASARPTFMKRSSCISSLNQRSVSICACRRAEVQLLHEELGPAMRSGSEEQASYGACAFASQSLLQSRLNSKLRWRKTLPDPGETAYGKLDAVHHKPCTQFHRTFATANG